MNSNIMKDHKHVVIIGNGISGISAARHIRKQSNAAITIISSETKHFYSRTALMYIYMGHMKYTHTKPYEDWFWKKNRFNLVHDHAVSINTTQKELLLKDNEKVSYDILIIASGSKPNMFGWKGENLQGVQGLYHYQDLESMEKNTRNIKRAVIVGGGLIGIEMAEMLVSRNIPVTFLVRESSFWNNVLPPEESALINRHIREHRIDLRLSTELKEIAGDGKVKSVITSSGEEIPCEFVGLTAGVRPNIEFLKDSGIETDRGVLVNEYLETNIPEIYAIGDCVQHRSPLPERKAIEQVWYTGKMMGETVSETICGNKTAYQPGIWFNSAKFFDIEYQTYGWVYPEPKENEGSLYWEHKSGKKCLRFNYDKETGHLTGLNTFGIRLNQFICDNWIKNEYRLADILEEMEKANFDPEFYRKHEKEIRQQFSVQLMSCSPKSTVHA
jgi:NAD(P)H-nitrite reductase large subunit